MGAGCRTFLARVFSCRQCDDVCRKGLRCPGRLRHEDPVPGIMPQSSQFRVVHPESGPKRVTLAPNKPFDGPPEGPTATRTPAMLLKNPSLSCFRAYLTDVPPSIKISLALTSLLIKAISPFLRAVPCFFFVASGDDFLKTSSPVKH